jgi:hypothetical protein
MLVTIDLGRLIDECMGHDIRFWDGLQHDTSTKKLHTLVC